MSKTYGIKRDPRSNDWMVYRLRDKMPVFYHEDKAECREYIERTGDDENN